jgi:hypothetical protein
VASLFALFTGLVTALGAALLAPREDLADTLKSGTREGTYRRSRARSALLVLQGTLSVLLLVGAGLFVRSLDRVREMRLGFDPEQVLIATRNLRGLDLTDGERGQLGQRLLEAAEAIPGVESASLGTSIPFWATSSMDLFVAGIDSVRRLGRFTYQQATPEYFGTMGTRILRGRGLHRGGSRRCSEGHGGE